MLERYVLTGAPGSGKTAILRDLERRSYQVVEEAATDIICYEQARGVPCPWEAPEFLESIVHLQKARQFRSAPGGSGICFFDRSPICTAALAAFLGVPPPQALEEELHRIAANRTYCQKVFFVQNLGFCTPTAARTLDFETALAFERIHRETYLAFGCHLVEIPPGPLNQRTERILAGL